MCLRLARKRNPFFKKKKKKKERGTPLHDWVTNAVSP